MGHGHGHGHGGEDYDWAALGEELERNADVHRDFLDQAMDWLRGQLDEPARIVDVGSGPGVAACALAETFGEAEVVAADRAPELLELAQKRAARLGVQITTLRADLPEAFDELGAADLIWTSGVMHHIGDQQHALNRLGRMLRPGGVLAVVEGGLTMRFLPRDIGIGRPGLQSRLDAANDEWFSDMRAGLPGSTRTVEDWAAMLAKAGLMPSASRTFLVDIPAPLDTGPRRMLRDSLARQRDMLGDRIDAEDHAVIDRLVHSDDRESLLWRPDAFMLNARTVHSARRLGDA
jgi:SAM-dependent methyltransferase